MPNKTTSIRNALSVIAVAILFIVTTALSGTSYAATSCNPMGYSSLIGTETVAISCVPDGMNDNTALYYKYRDYECINGVVTKTAEGNVILNTPNGILNPGIGIYYRNFRNKEGTYFFTVTSWYRGTINGKLMTSYPTGGIYTDVFTKMFDESLTPPKCKKTQECNSCPCSTVPIGSTADLSTGALSHNQELFSLKGGTQPLSINLAYTSDPFAPSTIGNGWSHSYEQSLQILSNGSVNFWNEGKEHDYRLYSGVYYAAVGNYSTLVKNGDGSYTLAEKNGLVRNFDATGHITSLVDRNGNSTTFTYTSNKLTGVTDPNGRSATFSYDGTGKLATITDPLNNVYTFTYTGGLLTKITAPDTGEWNYTYTASNKLATKTDPLGNSTTYAYDSSNRVTSGTDPQSQTRSVDYVSGGGGATRGVGKVPDPYRRCDNVGTIDPNNPIINGNCEQTSVPVTEKNGAGWIYEYEYASNTLKSKTDPYNNKTTYIHDTNGQVLAKTEPGIGTTWYTYDSTGNTLTVKNPLNQTTSYTYNSFGQVLTTSGPLGNSSNSYDTKGNMLTATDTAGATTTYEYDTRGNVTKITNARNQITTMTYTSAGLLETVTDPAGIVTSYTYDVKGNMLTATGPNGTTTYEYDTMNRLTKITDPLANITNYGYDKSGNRTSQTDGNGKITTYSYNYQGQVTEAKDALNKTTTFSYGANACPTCSGGVDKLTALTDAKQQTTSYDYDLVSRLSKEIDPLGKNTIYGYNAAGNLTSKTDGNNKTTTYSYDALGRLLSRIYSDGTSDTFTYNAAGNLATASNATISYTFAYDTNNRLASATDNSGRAISYTYDAIGNRTQMTAPDGRITTYAYDNKNRLTTLTNNGQIYTFTYDSLDRRLTLTNPNGTYTTYGYDANSRITSLITQKSGGAVINSIALTYDNTTNRITKTEPTGTTNYNYDAIYRLIKSALGVTTKELFTYDVTGNRTTGPQVSTAYTIASGNQLTASPNTTFTYDGNGNIITKTNLSGTYTYIYDGENRLTEVRFNDAAIATYKYDPLGRRIEKSIVATPTITSKYLYDGANILYEYDDANAIKTRYTHNLAIDDPLAIEAFGTLYTYHKDTLGSIRAITDSTQTTINTYRYDSFGITTPIGPLLQPYAYTGREFDWETGMYYYRARTYDSKIGRFIQKDPISFAGGDVNLYGYVQNNPVNYTDPTGLAPSFILPPPKKPGEGCGDEKTDCIVPDLYPGACSAHDNCYSTPGKTRTQCDNEFWWDMFVESGPSPNVIVPTFYWAAVRMGGGSAFVRAQGAAR